MIVSHSFFSGNRKKKEIPDLRFFLGNHVTANNHSYSNVENWKEEFLKLFSGIFLYFCGREFLDQCYINARADLKLSVPHSAVYETLANTRPDNHRG